MTPTVTRKSTTSLSDPAAPDVVIPPDVATLTGDLVTHVEIVKVTTQGDLSEATLTIKSFIDPATHKELLPAGTVLTVTEGDKDNPTTAVIKGGHAVSPETLAILNTWFPPHTDGPTDDETFGSQTPRAVGDSWKADPKFLVKGLASAGITAKPDAMTGTATLKSASTADAGPALRVVMNLVAKDIKPNDIPEGVTLESNLMTMSYDKLLPQDPAGPVLQESMTMDMTMKMNAGGKVITVVATEKQSAVYMSAKAP